MTYGTLKFRLTKAFPGLDADLLEGWIADRYAEILGVLPWSRMQVEAILLTTAPYTTGTVAVTLGSASVTVTTGVWTTGMTGRAFRVGTRDEYYEFTYASASTGTLDRVYEGTTDAAATYSIFQSVYPMPANCRILEDDAFQTFNAGQMRRFHRDEAKLWSRFYPGAVDTPTAWASYMEDGSTPPRLQVELYPPPGTAVGIPFTYVAEGTALTTASQILQVWMQPSALIEGVTAKIKRHLKDYLGAKEHDAEAAKALALMIGAEAQGMPHMRMRLDSHYTAHRSRRTNR